MPASLQIRDSRSYRNGFLAAAGAFVIWGLLPLYLKPLNHVPAVVVSAVRAVMACVFSLGWLAVRGELHLTLAALRDRAVRNRLLLSSLLINCNWLIYAWAIANGRVIESSLGYFINPLFVVTLSVVVLSERLNKVQWAAVALAALGVGYLAWIAGQPPWLALGLAFSFGLYGLIRKLTPVAPLPGLAAEVTMFLPVALLILWYCAKQPSMRFELDTWVGALLLLSGALTAIPLVLFAYGTQRIPYATVGMLQYIGPTLQLILGIVLYHEPFSGARAIGFGLIWLALLLYAGDSLLRARNSGATGAPPPIVRD